MPLEDYLYQANELILVRDAAGRRVALPPRPPAISVERARVIAEPWAAIYGKRKTKRKTMWEQTSKALGTLQTPRRG